MTSTVRAIVFDLDGTLWHLPVQMTSEVANAHSARQIEPLLTEWGVTCNAFDLCGRLLVAVEHARRESAAGALLSPAYAEVLDGVLREAGIILDARQLNALWTAWQVDAVSLGRQLYPDTVTTLAWAKQQGYRLGLISNRWSNGAYTERELDSFNLGRIFDAITVSSDAGWLKPHPEIFYAALRALGTAPEETLIVGDSLRTDIAPAKMLGMRAVWKRNGRRDRQPDPAILPDAVIDDLWELCRIPVLTHGSSLAARIPSQLWTADQGSEQQAVEHSW